MGKGYFDRDKPLCLEQPTFQTIPQQINWQVLCANVKNENFRYRFVNYLSFQQKHSCILFSIIVFVVFLAENVHKFLF